MVNYVATVMDLVPNAKISYTGIEIGYEDITWLDERPKPTQAECDARWPSLEVEIHNANAERARAEAFREDSDPLFFGWQREENTKQDWLDKVEEIRARFPYLELE
jgi:hypothetical protein